MGEIPFDPRQVMPDKRGRSFIRPNGGEFSPPQSAGEETPVGEVDARSQHVDRPDRNFIMPGSMTAKDVLGDDGKVEKPN